MAARNRLPKQRSEDWVTLADAMAISRDELRKVALKMGNSVGYGHNPVCSNEEIGHWMHVVLTCCDRLGAALKGTYFYR